jgi:hypothetical protein
VFASSIYTLLTPRLITSCFDWKPVQDDGHGEDRGRRAGNEEGEPMTSPSQAWPRAPAARRTPGRPADFLAWVGARCGGASFHACFCAATPRLRPGHLRRWEQGSRRVAAGENSRPSSSERVAGVTSLGGRCVQCKNTILLNFIELLLEFLQDCSHIVVQIRSGTIFSLQRQISCCCLGGKPTTEF